MNGKQQGFTLIELVMVIVILGILAAVALPKFANMGANAREASLKAAYGSVKTAMGIVHSQAVVKNVDKLATSTVTMDDGSSIAIAYGYPDGASIDEAAGLSATDYVITPSTTVSATVSPVGATTAASCIFTYTAATAVGTPASLSAITATGC